MKLTRPLATLLLVLGGSCTDAMAPVNGVVDESALTFLRVDPAAPPLIAHEVTVWAVRGEEREAHISYASTGSGYGKCLLFRIPAGAVPAGIAPGDSVRITVRLIDAGSFRFEFEPEGLQLDPAHPATLEISYRWANPDVDGDGDVDARDIFMTGTMTVWSKVGTTSGWTQAPGVERRNESLEVAVPVLSFTQYALATD